MERLPETTRTEPDENGIFTEISGNIIKNQLVKVTEIIKRTTTTVE